MMTNRAVATLIAGCLALQLLLVPAMAENQMGYTLLPANQAAQLPRGGGILGVDVSRGQQISDSGLTFELLNVNSVRRGSAGERSGLKVGDQIIAIDGRVFPSVAAFAFYVGSKQPGERISVDTMPANGGPQDAQRLGIVLGSSMPAAQNPGTPGSPEPGGLSTGTKIAIGVGAAALFGCYKYGCLSRLKNMRHTPFRSIEIGRLAALKRWLEPTSWRPRPRTDHRDRRRSEWHATY